MNAESGRLPDYYLGLWERVSLEEGGVLDTTTRVRWLQSRSLYCDVRVPAKRPDFRGVHRLEDCSDAQLRWLLGQEAFAGTLLVAGDACHWVRAADYQPDRTVPDRARMRFTDHFVIEEGTHRNYREVWCRLPPATTEMVALERVPTAEAMPHGFLLVVGDWFMYARERALRPPQAESLLALAEAADDPRAEMLRLADFEVSFGYRRGALHPWEITLSTLPFREGTALDLPHRLTGPKRNGGGRYCTDAAGFRWRVLEWSAGFRWMD